MLYDSSEAIPDRQVAIGASTGEDQLRAFQRHDVTTMTYPGLGSDPEEILSCRFRVEYDLARPASSQNPELALFV